MLTTLTTLMMGACRQLAFEQARTRFSLLLFNLKALLSAAAAAAANKAKRLNSRVSVSFLQRPLYQLAAAHCNWRRLRQRQRGKASLKHKLRSRVSRLETLRSSRAQRETVKKLRRFKAESSLAPNSKSLINPGRRRPNPVEQAPPLAASRSPVGSGTFASRKGRD